MKERRNLRWGEMDKGEMELNQLIQHFEIFNRSEGKSPKTIKWYSDVLNLFLRWLESEGISTQLGEVGEAEIRSFILHLQERKINGKPISTHTVANRVRGLRGFYSWLAERRYTKENVFNNIRLPKTTQIVIEPLTPEEVKLVFSNINEDTALGARNTAIMALFLDTGLRLSEVVNLKQEDVHLGHTDVYGRMVLGKPGPTITAKFDNFSRGRFGHQELDIIHILVNTTTHVFECYGPLNWSGSSPE